MVVRSFDEENSWPGSGASRTQAFRQRRERFLATPWPSVLATLLLGVLLGRYVVPSGPRFQDFSKWLKAAPTVQHIDHTHALHGTEQLPEAVANNLRLTHEECDAGFPLLWTEVEKTRKQFEARGGIWKSDVMNVDKPDYDGTRVAIIDGRLYVKRFHPESTTRSWAVLQGLHQAVSTAPEPIPDVEFWFRCTDNLIEGGHFGLNKQEGELMWLIPDFGFWSWPEPGVKGWNDFRRKVLQIDDMSWSSKKSKLFWRGAFLSDFRKELQALVRGKSWADIGIIDWGQGAAGRVEMVDHCRHKYLASIEGAFGYSGRLKHLLMCRSVTVSHKMKWIQHFHSALISDDNSPDQNIIELKTKDSWSELPAVMTDLVSNTAKAKKITDNVVRTMRGRYLTPASVACYWRRVLAEYASLQQFTPSIGDGTDFESFILMDQVHWEPS